MFKQMVSKLAIIPIMVVCMLSCTGCVYGSFVTTSSVEGRMDRSANVRHFTFKEDLRQGYSVLSHESLLTLRTDGTGAFRAAISNNASWLVGFDLYRSGPNGDEPFYHLPSTHIDSTAEQAFELTQDRPEVDFRWSTPESTWEITQVMIHARKK